MMACERVCDIYRKENRKAYENQLLAGAPLYVLEVKRFSILAG